MVTEIQIKQTLVVAITGASGAMYACRTCELLLKANLSVHLIITKTAELIIKEELPDEKSEFLLASESFHRHDPDSYDCEIASGSNHTLGMVIIPASMGTIGRIANGTSDNLVARVADVHLKEKRKLVIVPRETPLNRIHLENLLKLNDAGALILPAMPSFYSGADTVDKLVDTVIARVLNHLGISHGLDVGYYDRSSFL
ncbi:UbiX family flavin prenyltransferase [bacterium]|nr:UbiX family flavin prenyltransferase [bacterium]